MAPREPSPYGRCDRFLHDRRGASHQGLKQPAASCLSCASQTMLIDHEANI